MSFDTQLCLAVVLAVVGAGFYFGGPFGALIVALLVCIIGLQIFIADQRRTGR